MAFLSIPRERTVVVPDPGLRGAVPQGAGAGGAQLAETQTATYLSTESLTFPGVTGVAGILTLLYTRLSGNEPSAAVIVVIAVCFGAGLIALGLLDPKRADRTAYGTAVQVVVGALNTILLLAALLGVVDITT